MKNPGPDLGPAYKPKLGSDLNSNQEQALLTFDGLLRGCSNRQMK